MFTVKQLSMLAGVTPRALRHYDEIGLLKPSRVGDNGYRYYGEETLPRLQQILFYRELGMPLADIRKMMGRRDFDVLSALESHKVALRKQMERAQRLMQTVDDTIAFMKGEKTMSAKALFAAFSEEEQDQLAEEAARLYDADTVRESNRKWKSYPKEKREAILAEGNQIYADMVAVMPQGAESAEAQAVVERWRNHMNYFWTPAPEQLAGLAEMYVSEPRFRANFDKAHPQLAEFMREAVKVYVRRMNDKG